MEAVTLIASIPAFEDTAEEVYNLVSEYGEHVLSMEGSDRFEPYRDRDDPLVIVVLEQYGNEDAFAAHLADPENAALNGKLAQLTDGGSTLQFLTGPADD